MSFQKIVNPLTGKIVSVHGATGQRVVQAYANMIGGGRDTGPYRSKSKLQACQFNKNRGKSKTGRCSRGTTQSPECKTPIANHYCVRKVTKATTRRSQPRRRRGRPATAVAKTACDFNPGVGKGKTGRCRKGVKQHARCKPAGSSKYCRRNDVPAKKSTGRPRGRPRKVTQAQKQHGLNVIGLGKGTHTTF